MKAPEATPQIVKESPGESTTLLAGGILVILNLVGVEIDALGVIAILSAIPAAVKYWKSLSG